MKYKFLISILVFVSGLSLSLLIPTKTLAVQVTNICGLSTYDGMTGSGCDPCWSGNGSEGFCTDPSIGGYDTYIDIQACDSDQGGHNQCDGSTGGYGLANYNGGGTISSNSYIGSHCKIQLDQYKDNGGGRQLIGFLTVREPNNCGGSPPPPTPPPPPPPPSCPALQAQLWVPSDPAHPTYERRDVTIRMGDEIRYRCTSSIQCSGFFSTPNSSNTNWGPFQNGGVLNTSAGSVFLPFPAWYTYTTFPEQEGLPPGCSDRLTTTVLPPACSNIAPTGLTLTSPAEGATIPGTTTTLSWSLSSWGTNCAGSTNQYKVYVDDLITPVSTQTTSSLTGNYSYSGTSGIHTWKIVATNGATSIGTPTRSFTLQSSTLPWWQVSGGNVTAAGSIASKVTSGNVFITNPAGIAVSGSGSTDFNGQPVSSANWLVSNANSGLSTAVAANNSWTNLTNTIDGLVTPTNISSPVTSIAQLTPAAGLTDGVYYVRIIGNADLATTGPLDVGNAKIVLTVTGNADIKNRINLTNNTGFFILAAQGDINIDSAVGTSSYQATNPDLEGIYFAQGTFNTGSSTNYLRIEGIVVGMNGVNNQRQIYSANPAETYAFRPEMAVLAPAGIMRKQRTWEEVAP